jgi:hypothetical protein
MMKSMWTGCARLQARSEIKNSYPNIDLYVKLWYTYETGGRNIMDNFFGKCLVFIALFYLAIHVVVDFGFFEHLLFLK